MKKVIFVLVTLGALFLLAFKVALVSKEKEGFELISKATIDALMNLSIEHKKPIGNGIIACLNEKQAFERAETNRKNKGGEAAKAVLSVLEIFKDESK